MLCGCRSLFAIAQFGRDRGEHFAAALGFTRQTTPCCMTLHNLFLALDKVAFENAIAQWTHAAAEAHGWTTVSLAGKTLRGSADMQLPQLLTRPMSRNDVWEPLRRDQAERTHRWE